MQPGISQPSEQSCEYELQGKPISYPMDRKIAGVQPHEPAVFQTWDESQYESQRAQTPYFYAS